MSEIRICEFGHSFSKSSACPVCPVCEQNKKRGSFFEGLSAPACRALENAGISSLTDLSVFTEKEVLKFHGVGKSAIRLLKEKLNKAGYAFKSF